MAIEQAVDPGNLEVANLSAPDTDHVMVRQEVAVALAVVQHRNRARLADLTQRLECAILWRARCADAACAPEGKLPSARGCSADSSSAR
jgi:hypothetical protein